MKRNFSGRRLLVDGKQLSKTHIMCEAIFKRSIFVKHLVHGSPFFQAILVVDLLDLRLVEAIILSPVWSRLEPLAELVLYHLLELVNAVCSRQKWYLGKKRFKKSMKKRTNPYCCLILW